MNIPPYLYALGLINLMEQKGVDHFEFRVGDPKESAGLAINFWIGEDGLVTVATGRCPCEKCKAATGETQ